MVNKEYGGKGTTLLEKAVEDINGNNVAPK
jgi:hypothetical protein